MNQYGTQRQREWMREIYKDPVWAHEKLFRHRHPDETPDFHREVITAFHAPDIIRLLVLAFRGGGKSTIAEEAIALQACCRLFRNGVILCENQPRAMDRLAAIAHELTTNDEIRKIFGDQFGPTWGASKIVLRNGVVLQAFGRGQEVRGMKHLDLRPDYLFCDDLEAKEHVRSPEARHETTRWFFSEVLPACDKLVRVRMDATPLDREALPMQLQKDKRWKTLIYPVKHIDAESGEWRATWESRFPLERIKLIEEDFSSKGLTHDFAREYMCQPEDPSKKVFVEAMFRTVPRQHVWQPAFAAYDPARTTNERSATTGWAVWSWIANRLVIWDGGGNFWSPDDVISHSFATYLTYHPIWIGIEETGLNDWLHAPLRKEMVRRGIVLPIMPLQAPQGKRSFIEGLQPFFNAGEVEFAKDLPELKAQFLSYPTGRIDGPNAVAYAMKMRPGEPIYENFGPHHVVEDVVIWDEAPCWLILNSSSSYTCGILAQFCAGDIHVVADWLKEGDAGQNVGDIHAAAKLEIGSKSLRCVLGPSHFVDYDTIGLRPAVRRIPATIIQGSSFEIGRTHLRALFERYRKGAPCVLIGHAARWTINAMSAGFARGVDSRGLIKPDPEPGPYKLIGEALETFAGLLQTGAVEDDSHSNWAYTETGRPYKSIMPNAGGLHETKSDWLSGNVGRVTGVEHLPKSLRRPPR